MMENVEHSIRDFFSSRRQDYIKFVYFFGSAARREKNPKDIDIAVFFDAENADSTFEESMKLRADLCRYLKTDNVDLTVLNDFRNIVILNDILNEGKLIYCADKEFLDQYEIDVRHEVLDFMEHRKYVERICS